MSSSNNPIKTGRHCVHCGASVQRLYVQYSPGNIRLMKCEKCQAVADPYIECEFMAYRHLLFNMINLDFNGCKDILEKSGFAYLLLDAYRISVLKAGMWDSSNDMFLAIWTCVKILTGALLGNFVYMLLILIGIKFILKIFCDINRFKEVILAIIISSYLKLFLLSMMVWDFPSSVIIIIDIFVLSSNTIALKVVTQLGIGRCFGVCCLAYLAKILIDYFTLQSL